MASPPLDEAPTEDASLYAVLNVRRDASEDEIKRAYRQLASTLHPDKAPDPALHAAAAREFNRIQEAYEVLADPTRRDIYDVYGSDGLAAGMELAGPFRSREELRREWETFRAKRKQEAEEASFAHRGTYVFRTDATALVSPYAPNLPRTPQLTNIYMTSGMDIPIPSSKHWGALSSEQDVLHIGGLVSLRDNVGGGSFIAGYRRVYSDYTTVGLEASAGLRSLVSASANFRLSQHAYGGVVASWSPVTGVGLQVSTTRQLTEKTSGEFAWTLGPKEAAGMALSVTHRLEKMAITGRVEVGAATALALRIVRQLSDVVTGRVAFKFGTTGIEMDVGGTRRISDSTTAGLSVVAGVQGVLLRVRFSRSGHIFEFPILLAPSLDVRVLLGAYTLPPLALYVAKDWVVGPLGRAVEARRVAAERTQRAAEIAGALSQAAAAAAVMAPVALRRVRKEAAAQGLVVVLALYGEEQAVKEGAFDRLKAAATAEGSMSGAAPAETRPEGGADEIEGGNAAAQANVPVCGGDAVGSGAGARAIEDVPPAVADVTTAVRYLTSGGKVVFHQGYSKASLMGFCDPAPTASKVLLVYFTFQGRAYMAQVSDTEGAQLPARGKLIEDSEESALVCQLAESLQQPPTESL